MKSNSILAFFFTFAGLPLAAFAQSAPNESVEVLTTFVYPQANTSGTTAQGISNNGNIAGTFALQHHEHGFVRNPNGKFSPPITASPTARTLVQAINSAGVVAGWTIDTNGDHGFFFQNGVLTPYDLPGTDETVIYGLNDAGDFTGLTTTSEVTNAFASIGGTISYVGAAGSSFSWPHGINNRKELVGYYVDSINPEMEHGYFRRADGTSVEPLDFPGAANTQLFGVNDRGTVVGFWYDASGKLHGLVLRGLTEFTNFDVAGASSTLITGINNSGLITGYYFIGNTQFGFVGRLTP